MAKDQLFSKISDFDSQHDALIAGLDQAFKRLANAEQVENVLVNKLQVTHN